jgi:hypothetical protein
VQAAEVDRSENQFRPDEHDVESIEPLDFVYADDRSFPHGIRAPFSPTGMP